MSQDDRIAIIGMDFLFPGSHTREQLWRNVASGAISIRQFAEAELEDAGIPVGAYRDDDFMAASGVLPDITGFDAEFFGMSGREADLTDPQQRLFLECCYHALEDGGYAAPGKGTRVSVYASTGYSIYPFNTYLLNGIGSAARSGDWISDMQCVIGNSNDFMATRVAFRLGLTGPAMNIQAGCSSSLIALDLASQALRGGDADLALVGAAAVHVPQVVGYGRTRGSILSRDGQCRAFDADANGTVGGNGVAAVLLKRLGQALLDGDTIHAVIEGCGIVNDGDSKQSYSAPSAAGQRDAVLRALDKAGLTARDIGYLETHGTGTYKGDRIELEGLTAAFRAHTGDAGFCALGTSKPAIGHLDACAGMAGLIKAALVLGHGEIPPLPNFRRPHPILPLDDSPFYFPTRPQSWPQQDGLRRAGVHALGIGGTNAHVILAEAPAPAPRRRSPAAPTARAAPGLLPLSGRSEAALRASARAHRDRLRNVPDTDLTDLVTTAALGRRHLRHRLVVQGRSTGELAERLDTYLSDRHERPNLLTGVAPDVPLLAFLFTGQGSLYAGMASSLYERFDVVRETLDEAHDALRTGHGIHLLDSLLRPAGTDVWSTDLAQPTLFALQAAMVRLWQSAGVEPVAVAGHSVGEYAALYCSGALSLADGLRLTAERGRLFQDRTEPGGMVAVLADRSTAQTLLADVPDLELSVANGPLNHVLAGPVGAVDAACVLLDARRVHHRRLPVDRAFHTALLDPVREELAGLLSTVEFHPVRVPFISGLDGGARPAGWLPDADYLVRQARLPVRFDLVLAAVERQEGVTGLLEIGPDAVLARLARQLLDDRIAAVPTQRQGDESSAFWSAVARLYCWGADLDWTALLQGCGGRRIPLPLYPFQKVRHWAEQPQAEEEERESTMSDRVLESITELAARHLGCAVAEVTPERPFVDLGADSLQMIAMLRDLEQEFHVQVSMRELLEEADAPGRLAQLITSRTDHTDATAHDGPPAPTAGPGNGSPAPTRATALAPPAARTTPPRSDSALFDPMARLAGISQALATVVPAPEPVHPTAGRPSAPRSAAEVPADTPPLDPAGTAPSEPPAPAARPVVHGPQVSVPISSGMTGTDASASQREHLDELVLRYTARTRTSRELARRYRKVLADSRAVVGFRRATKQMQYPIAARSASGAWVDDVDGNRYLDITTGFGVLLFGHEPEFVAEPVREHLARGIRLGPRGQETGEAAELLSTITGMERVAFANSGTEANSAAIRLARAATGRDTVVMFTGSYHGHADSVLCRAAGAGSGPGAVPVSRGIPQNAVADCVVLEYGAQASLDTIEELGASIAAVLVEPVQSRHPDVQPGPFLAALRDITRRHGAVLVFDEMLTGFRPHLRGAQGHFGVRADLATYGKVLGGGFPIGAIAGSAAVMDGVDGGFWDFDDDSYPPHDTTFFGGTYIQHPVSMVAAKAVLTHLKEHSPALQERLNARTDSMATTLNRFFTEEEFPLRVNHFGSMFRFEHHADMELLYYHLLLKGVFVWEWRNFFLSTAHTDSDVEYLVDAVTGSLKELRDAGYLRPPTTTPVRQRPANALPDAPAPQRTPAPRPTSAPAPRRTPDLSLYFFGDYPQDQEPSDGESRYTTLLDAARYADDHGFHSVWLPERHFHSFGGLFPNPSVLAAALAVQTRLIRINAGSVVLPLHDPIRVAEEWSMVDNLSGGRVGIGCAAGWNSDDFVFYPERFGQHRELTYQCLQEVRQLWAGRPLDRASGNGRTEVRLFPRPVQRTVPMFAAVVSRPESYRQAARHDLGIVSNLMTQSVDELAQNIALYRAAREEHGLDPATGRVVVLLHTYLAKDHDTAREEAREPLFRYMRSSLSLFSQVTNSLGQKVDLKSADPDDLDYLFRRAYDRYCTERALIGSPDTCAAVLDTVHEAGADEIAALVDFGVRPDQLRAGLPCLDQLRRRQEIGADTSASGPVTLLVPAEESDEAPVVLRRSAPATRAQRGLWTAARLAKPTAYNELQAVRLRGPLDVPALRSALRMVTERHDGLRTVFREASPDDGTSSLRQVVLDTVDVPCPVHDRAGDDAETAVEDALRRTAEHVYDLAEGPLLTASVTRLADDDHLLVLGQHHIVTDSRSAQIVMSDLSACYRAALDGGPAAFDRPAASCLDLVEPAHDEADLAWWRERLGEVPPVLRLPTDRHRGRGPGGDGASVTARIGAPQTAQLRTCSGRAHVTLYATLATAWQIVLRRLSGQDDFLLGTTFGERPPGMADTVGYFVSLLPVRCTLDDTLTVRQAVRATRDALLEATARASVPLDRLVAELNPDPGAARPLVPVSIDFEGDTFAHVSLPGVDAEPVAGSADTAPLELMLLITRNGDGLDVRLKYDTNLYDADTARRCLDQFVDTAQHIAACIEERVGDLPVMTEAEALRVGRLGHGEPLAGTPDLPGSVLAPGGPHDAVLDEDVGWSRDRLHGTAAAIADRLTERGLGRGDLVAVVLPKSPAYAAAMLGVARAGAAYLPLDHTQPPQRLSAILDDARPRAVICASGTASLPPETAGLPRIALDDLPETGPEPAVRLRPRPDDLMYVVHTSGSTGRPKGVEVSYGNLAAMLAGYQQQTSVTPGDRLAWYGSAGFDFSQAEVWPALIHGASLHVIPERVRLDPEALLHWLDENRVTVVCLPTPVAEMMLPLPWPDTMALRWMCVGGEKLNLRPRPGLPFEVINVYGPTETTVFCTWGPVAPHGPQAPPLGRPLPGTLLEVRDGAGRLVPQGVVGELHIGGARVAQGYRGSPELTERRFRTDEDGVRWYASGDQVRWRSDGLLEYRGRIDDQVQIHGVRVEPAEVTRAVLSLPGVREAMVYGTTDADTGLSTLTCCVCPDKPVADEAAAVRTWRSRLANLLPRPMVPEHWSVGDRLPLASLSGKRDLTAVLAQQQKSADVAAATDDCDIVATTVREVWRDVLATQDIPDDASFFDLGGHSLLVIKALGRIESALGSKLSLTDFFEDPTIAGTVRILSARPVKLPGQARRRGQL